MNLPDRLIVDTSVLIDYLRRRADSWPSNSLVKFICQLWFLPATGAFSRMKLLKSAPLVWLRCFEVGMVRMAALVAGSVGGDKGFHRHTERLSLHRLGSP
jgi:hypothetical protein